MQRPFRNSRLPHQSSPRSAHRQAFSLIELMVVMLIISLLMGLLLVGVRGAISSVRVASVTVDLKNLENAILNFKVKYGVDPPSGVIVFESPTGWSGSVPSPAEVRRSRNLIRQIWPDFDFSIPRDLNGDSDTTDRYVLNGAECLVFFLGGVPVRTGNPDGPWVLNGFSENATDPLSQGGARVGPFFEFDPSRLMNFEGDSSTDPEYMPEYRDSLPSQKNPILYASSYGGLGYRDADVQLTSQPVYSTGYSTPPTGFAYVYRRYTGSYPASTTNFNSAPFLSPKSVQLISPGIDGEYGWGGLLNNDMELVEPRIERAAERDNITNFKNGKIN
ncbi:MAG: prepilin-type N-terminal cleavage/methylation domain-containing protein [Planctomycetaceae bacterium]